jgi:hypothetical protein
MELHNSLLKLGLLCSSYDPTLYFKLEKKKLVGTISIHVDNLLVIGIADWVFSLIASLGNCFKIGADEELNHFIPLKITQDCAKKLIYLSQSHYVEDTQEQFLSGDHIDISTPSNSSFKHLHKQNETEDVSSGPYPQLIGCLLWLAQCTQPNISFVVNRLSQFLRDSSQSHWLAAIGILINYVISTKSLRLRLGGSLSVGGYSNSDWAEDRENQRSTSGYTYCIGEGAISWCSKKC